MKKEKIKAIIYQHPYLLDDAFQMSLSEADQWAQKSSVNIYDTLKGAKEKHPEIPAADWQLFETALNKKRGKVFQKKAVIFPIKAWQFAAAVLMFFVLFFTLISPARAFAESIYKYIVSIFDDRLDVHSETEQISHEQEINPPFPADISDENGIQVVCYGAMDDFVAHTNRIPVIIKSNDSVIEKIEYFFDGQDIEWLETTYIYNSHVMVVMEDWGSGRSISLFKEKNDELFHTTILDAKEVAGYISRESGGSIISIILSDSVLTISYEGDVDCEVLLSLLSYYP